MILKIKQIRISDRTTTLAYQYAHKGCRKVPFGEVSTWDALTGYVYEEKMDGVRYFLQVRPNHARWNYLTSRHISKKTGLYVEKDKPAKILTHAFPRELDGAIFDGELCGSGISSDVQHEVMTGDVTYVYWDIVRLNGVDLRDRPLSERLDTLKKLEYLLPPWMTPVRRAFKRPSELLAEVVARSGEGLVRKPLTGQYGEGWLAAKGSSTDDVVVIGYGPSNSADFKSKGWIGSIRIGQFVKMGPDVELPPKRVISTLTHKKDKYALVGCGKTSGFSNEVRDEVSKHQQEFMGRIMEVKCHLRLKSRMFRSPRFMRFRDDKNPWECIWKQPV